MCSEKSCYYSEKYKRVIHVFQPGKCRCICGKRVIRKPFVNKKIDFYMGGDIYVK